MSNDTRPVLDPRTQWFLQFLKDLNRPQVWEVTVDHARAMQVKGQELFPVAKLPAQLEDRSIPVGPRGNVQIRIVRPESATGVLPVVMYFHGGGFRGGVGPGVAAGLIAGSVIGGAAYGYYGAPNYDYGDSYGYYDNDGWDGRSMNSMNPGGTAY